MQIVAIVSLFLCGASDVGVAGGRGTLFGEDHVFAVTAKATWVLDNESGVNQGLHMVFYPKGNTWDNSPVVVYGQVTPTSEIASVEAKVERTVNDFHEQGSPNYKSEAQPPLEMPDGRKAALYYYSGDQWGNFEAVVYFLESDTINFLVFNARTQADFDRYISDFRAIAASYRNLYSPPASITKEVIEGLEMEAASLLANPEGVKYEAKALQATGTTLANAMRQCTACFEEDDKLESFAYFVRIGNDGHVVESLVSPAGALGNCFLGVMEELQYPAHEFKNCVLKLGMEVSQRMREEAASQRGLRPGQFVLKGGLEP